MGVFDSCKFQLTNDAVSGKRKINSCPVNWTEIAFGGGFTGLKMYLNQFRPAFLSGPQ